MATRTHPYGAFNFLVTIDGADTLGGFSDVSGLSTEIAIAEYREGTDKPNHVRKIAGLHKMGDVTLKRGVVDSTQMWAWITQARTTGVVAQKNVVVNLLDEARNPVQRWLLRGVIPMKYTGPTLAAKGGEVAMEELVLSCEALEIERA
jgi:phage tail-like protein